MFLGGNSIAGIFGAILTGLAPLVIALDVASASSYCESLQQALNDKRKETVLDVATDGKLQVLERAIRLENRGAGIGFVVAGGILDRSSLMKIFAAMSGALGTVVPLFFAMQPRSDTVAAAATSDVCALSSSAILGIQGMLSERNASCVYNITIDEVLGV